MSAPLAIVGPTATGKTDIAVAIASEIDAEIVVCDSMTIYRGMDVGTAKPSIEQRARVPHHLLDIAEPDESFTVARFQAEGRRALADIAARGKRALIVGGSGLYFRALVDDLEFPPTDAATRARLEDEPTAALATRLRRDDPDAAAFVDVANRRRVVRALEVLELTGRPFSSFRGAWDHHNHAVVAGLDAPADLLDRRIRARLRAQLDAGLLEEVRTLLARGLRDSLTASRAIPYPEAIDLAEGTIDESGFIERGARANRKLARRQRAWFRADPRVRWFDATDPAAAEAAVRAYFMEHLSERTV